MKLSTRVCSVIVLAAPLLLAACGKSEADHRTAFKQFLQVRVIDRPGIAVPKMSAEEQKDAGDYADQYRIITDFHHNMNETVEPIGPAMKQGTMRSINDLVERRAELESARKVLNDVNEQLQKQKADADKAHAALTQPEDLKTVYDQAYNKLVTAPATAYGKIFPAVDKTLDLALSTSDYIEANKSKIDVRGSIVTVSDPKVQAELNKRLQAIAAQGGEIGQAQKEISALMGR